MWRPSGGGVWGERLISLQQVVHGKIASQPKQSIRSVIKTKTERQIKKLAGLKNTCANNSIWSQETPASGNIQTDGQPQEVSEQEAAVEITQQLQGISMAFKTT